MMNAERKNVWQARIFLHGKLTRDKGEITIEVIDGCCRCLRLNYYSPLSLSPPYDITCKSGRYDKFVIFFCPICHISIYAILVKQEIKMLILRFSEIYCTKRNLMPA